MKWNGKRTPFGFLSGCAAQDVRATLNSCLTWSRCRQLLEWHSESRPVRPQSRGSQTARAPWLHKAARSSGRLKKGPHLERQGSTWREIFAEERAVQSASIDSPLKHARYRPHEARVVQRFDGITRRVVWRKHTDTKKKLPKIRKKKSRVRLRVHCQAIRSFLWLDLVSVTVRPQKRERNVSDRDVFSAAKGRWIRCDRRRNGVRGSCA